jgi:KaiC/GvpD/RAD55 family RecA-like ATPase
MEQKIIEAWQILHDHVVILEREDTQRDAEAQALAPIKMQELALEFNKEAPYRLTDESVKCAVDQALYDPIAWHTKSQMGAEIKPEWCKEFNSFIDSSFTLKSLAQEELPAPPSYFDTFMVKGSITLVHAAAGVGKTPFAMHLCNAMLGNHGLLGWEAGTEGVDKVLYMDGELPLWLLKQRALSCFDPRHLDNVKLFSAAHWYNQGNSGLDLSNKRVQDQVEDFISESGAGVVVMDNRSNFYHGKENENDEAHELNRFLIKIREQGTAIIINHHQGKAGGFRGASAIVDVMDNVISLTRNTNTDGDPINDEITINFEKSRFGWPSQSTKEAIMVAKLNNFYFAHKKS